MFAAEGAHVVVTDVDPRGEAVVAEIHAAGGNALFVQLDVTDPDSVAAAFATDNWGNCLNNFSGLNFRSEI